ncbi:radical S-adenosyl methionine domain-containing protein 1, mitochondrial isoform X1 [Bufo gargarizans]|uniref:radical S-adenosyl methionine domain-containing protein 1, mitochondrial isoform X1 n=1 Tax=Bufo gargarizans TaxID=30331 RepID=UPI001CF49127|nr:radical S-adenosyl methionine domain-containing protein 1, mitochondrial isoform X1 [Bufo gargarizans]
MLRSRVSAPAVAAAIRSVCARSYNQEVCSAEEAAAVYVHWPYCEKRCTYCNFNKYIARSDNEDAIRSCLVQEAHTLIQLSQVRRVPSVFFGGGTPSLASPSTIGAVLEAIAKYADLPADAEISLEANPTSSRKSKLQQFRDVGVNRLSIGVQSLNDHDLLLLGRTHTASDAQRTLEEASKIFPGQTSVDVMFGLPGQSLGSWHSTLHRLLEQCDDHVSLYQLTLERGTMMFKWKEKAQVTFPDQELTAQMYDDARWILQQAGFQQYEVSNFARNGAVSKHNLTYWLGKQYIGIGPGAHGRFVVHSSRGKRRQARIQTLEPEPWMQEVMSYGHGTRKVTEQNDFDILSELLVLGLRTDIGISHKRWHALCHAVSLHGLFEASQELRDLQENGLLVLDHTGLRCTWRGLAVLDGLLPTLLSQFQDSWAQSENIKPHRPQTTA